MSLRRTRRKLYGAARILGDVEAARSPRGAARRIKNRAVGRVLGRTGVWRRLWR